ncbi:anaerobic ribonucleoside-triphosphate reductase activating protein [bacterium]
MRYTGFIKMEIKGFIETSLIDWRGKIASLIFTGGCNFRCPFCHNRELVLEPDSIETIDHEYVLVSLQNRKKWLDGVVITGGEPTLRHGLENFINKIKELGLCVKLDTNGTMPDVLKKLFDKKLVDYVALDIKTALDNERYSHAAGTSVSVDKICETIALLVDYNIDHEFRTTLVPGIIDKDDIISIFNKIKDTAKKWVWQDFRPVGTLDESFTQIEPYSKEIVNKYKELINNSSILICTGQ